MYSSTLSLTSALDVAALPQGKTWYPLYRKLRSYQEQSGRVRKISPSPGFDPHTVQPVTSHYTDRAVPAHVGRISVLLSLHLYCWAETYQIDVTNTAKKGLYVFRYLAV
jgi:hypothetical protein